MIALLSAQNVYHRRKAMKTLIELTLLTYLFAVNILISTGCPHITEDAKSAYKAGAVTEFQQPITLDTIKKKLRDSGIFDEQNVTLNAQEKKELAKLFEAVEIMTMSRNRQPPNVQNMFSSLRIVERAVKKSLKEGQISDTLASKFKWEKLVNPNQMRLRRNIPLYYLDKKTNMRVFNTE